MKYGVLAFLVACHSHALDTNAGQRIRGEALALRPHKPADWRPAAGERVMFRNERRDSWHLGPHAGDPLVDDIYPFLATRDRPPAEVGAYVACAPSGDGVMLFAQVQQRRADGFSALGEDGRTHALSDVDCVPLEGRFVDPVAPEDTPKHVLGWEADMPPSVSVPVEHETVDLPKDAHGDVGLWPNILHDGDRVIIAYCDGFLGDVKLAYRDKDKWQIETVDRPGAVGKYLTAAMGPHGPELVYLDQGRHVLRYARRVADHWQIDDIAKGEREIGIAARLVIGPLGERDVLHYSTEYQFLLTQGTLHGEALTWTTRVLDRAVGTYQSTIGAVFDSEGWLHLSYPEQNIGDPALRITSVPPPGLAASQPAPVIGVYDTIAAQTELIPTAEGRELFYLSGNDVLNLANVDAKGRAAAVTVVKHVRAFKAIKLASGVVGLAIAIGPGTGQDGIDGIGGGRFEFAWRANGKWQRIILDEHTSPYFSVTERVSKDGASTVDFAYYDDLAHSLKHAGAQIFGPRTNTAK